MNIKYFDSKNQTKPKNGSNGSSPNSSTPPQNENGATQQTQDNTAPQTELTNSLQGNINLFKNIFKSDQTVIIREFQNKHLSAAKCCIVYVDGMVDTKVLNEHVIEPVLRNDLSTGIDAGNLLEELMSKVIFSSDVTIATEISKIVGQILYGDTLFLLEGYNKSLIIESKGWKTRSITEPESAKVIRGPREGFNESIMMNLSMVRRKIKDPGLKFEFREIGAKTHTYVCISYIEDIALEGVINELRQRLDQINIDGILDSGYIQELIRDSPYSTFETVGSSERPDVIASKLLEGRVALFVDGSPFVLTVPYLMLENFQANEDYYNNYLFSSFNRITRGLMAIATITIPAIFLSLVTFQQEMLPTALLLSISASRKDVPFPTALSLFMMLAVFDILREVGVRMPGPIGQAVNIVGTLVLGQAAVEARLVSAPVVIITALTGITTLLNMNYVTAIILYRNIILLGASFMGIYGFFLCFIILHLQLMGLRSFGIPYMMNMTRIKDHDGQDAWIRAPWWSMTLRPKIFAAKNQVRQVSNRNKGK
jgi:Bacillus/Clostridium GerA spore germination protein.